jgi:hypothetical protein
MLTTFRRAARRAAFEAPVRFDDRVGQQPTPGSADHGELRSRGMPFS